MPSAKALASCARDKQRKPGAGAIHPTIQALCWTPLQGSSAFKSSQAELRLVAVRKVPDSLQLSIGGQAGDRLNVMSLRKHIKRGDRVKGVIVGN